MVNPELLPIDSCFKLTLFYAAIYFHISQYQPRYAQEFSILSQNPRSLSWHFSQLTYDYLIILFRTLSYRINRYALCPGAVFIRLAVEPIPGRFNLVFWFFLLCRLIRKKAVLCICHIYFVLMLVSLLASVSVIPMTALANMSQNGFKPFSDSLSAIAPSGTLRSIAASIQSTKFFSPWFCINI